MTAKEKLEALLSKIEDAVALLAEIEAQAEEPYRVAVEWRDKAQALEFKNKDLEAQLSSWKEADRVNERRLRECRQERDALLRELRLEEEFDAQG